MKKTLLTAGLVALVFSAQAGVKEIGEVNGLKIVRIKTCGVFAPSTTTIVAYDPTKPGTIEGILNNASNPGVFPSAVTAGGIVGGAVLLRPARSNTNVSAGNGSSNSEANSTATGNGNATTTGSQHVPPGHINNPSGNH